jgi:hypothetical protein
MRDLVEMLFTPIMKRPTRRQGLVPGWAKKHPDVDEELLAWLAHHGEANSAETSATMLAWDIGYEGDSLPAWLVKLGKQMKLDIQAEYSRGRSERSA